MDAEEAWKIDSDEAWERFKGSSVFKSSSSDKLDTMNAMLNDMKVTMDRMATAIPGVQADAAAINSANASAQPPMGMDMGMGGPGMIPDVSQMSGEDDFESEDEDMADDYDDSNIPMKDEETPEEEMSPAEGAPTEEPPAEETPVEEVPEEAAEEEVAEEMPEELPPAPIEDAGLGGATDIGAATNNLMNALDQQIMQAVQSGDKEGVMKLMDQKTQITAILETPIASNPAEPVPGAEEMSAPETAPVEGAAEGEAPAEESEMSDEEISSLIDDILSNKTEAVKASASEGDTVSEAPVVGDVGAATDAGMTPGGTAPNDESTMPVEASNSADNIVEPTVKSEGEHPATARTTADGMTLASIEDMIAERLGGKVNKACSESVNMAASDKTTPVEASDDKVAEAGTPVSSIGSGDASEAPDLIGKPQDAIAKTKEEEKDDENTIAAADNPEKVGTNSSEGKRVLKSYNEMVAEWNAVKKGEEISQSKPIGEGASPFGEAGQKDPDEIEMAADPKTTIASTASEEKDDEATIEAAEPAQGAPAGDQGTQSTMKSEEYRELIDSLRKSNKISEEDYTKLSMWDGTPVKKSEEEATVKEEPAPGKVMKSFRETLMEINNGSNFQMPASCTPAGDVVEAYNSVRKSKNKELPGIVEMIEEMRAQ